MQIYTKIFIGMVVGIALALLAGPRSPFFERDLVLARDPGRLRLLRSPGGPPAGVELPALPAGAPPLRLSVLERRGAGRSTYLHVRLTISRRLALADAAGRLKAGAVVDAWVDSAGLPEPVSARGHAIIAAVDPVGRAFLLLIKMVIVPLVFASLLVGVASLGNPRKLGRLGGKTLGYFLTTTIFAITIGLGLANIVQPGSFVSPEDRAALEAEYERAAESGAQVAAATPSAVDNLLAIIPANPAQALADGKMLQIIFFAAILGVCLTFIEKERAARFIGVMEALNDAMVACVNLVMKLAPYGVLALVAKVVAGSGASVLRALAVYALVVLAGLLIHALAVYTTVARMFGGLSPRAFWRAIRPAQLIAFSTSSSSATLPVTMRCAEERIGISRQVSAFVLPLGSTVNMDGTALYQGVAAVFIAQVFGIHLTLGDQVTIVLTATLASVGAAGVPGVGMITLALVLTSIGVPTIGVALILGVDRVLDMFRTAVNVTGDLSAAVLVASTEGERLSGPKGAGGD